ncbi:MAG: class I SAM-dependent methyltransferase [Alphaproteobacteria bacterium]|nr:class I SAM-dependent methyltransferase [Alphaproteobacteria bacterium]
MAQNLNGIRSILSVPWVYELYQSLVGAGRLHALLAETAVTAKTRDLLDLGCGPGTLVGHLPDSIRYVGIDLSPAYIEQARERHPSNEFHAADVNSVDLGKQTFDTVTAMGLFHHLEDNEVHRLLERAKDVLRPGGQFLSIDPSYSADQSMLARIVVGADRGKNVRPASEYAALAKAHFPHVEIEVNHRLLRIPFTACLLRCTFE